jgi:hypothetical protein
MQHILSNDIPGHDLVVQEPAGLFRREDFKRQHPRRLYARCTRVRAVDSQARTTST